MLCERSCDAWSFSENALDEYGAAPDSGAARTPGRPSAAAGLLGSPIEAPDSERDKVKSLFREYVDGATKRPRRASPALAANRTTRAASQTVSRRTLCQMPANLQPMAGGGSAHERGAIRIIGG